MTQQTLIVPCASSRREATPLTDLDRCQAVAIEAPIPARYFGVDKEDSERRDPETEPEPAPDAEPEPDAGRAPPLTPRAC
jgi:hypothetical protein